MQHAAVYPLALDGDVWDLLAIPRLEELAMIVDCGFVLLVVFDSTREWLCGCSNRLG